MTQPAIFTREDMDDSPLLPVIIEHQNGQCQEIEDVTVALGVLVHEVSRQAFPLGEPMMRLLLSLDGDYSEYDGDFYYFDDELSDPTHDEAMVHGAEVAACEAAEAGEYEEPEAVKANARLQLIAAVGGVLFLLLMGFTCMGMVTGLGERFLG